MKKEGGNTAGCRGAVKKENGKAGVKAVKRKKKVAVKKEKRPAAAENVDWEAVTSGLANLHPEVTSRNVERRDELLKSCGAGSSVILDAVISTMLSQNTTDKNSREAFGNLTERFKSWSDCLKSSKEDVEGLIRVAGLAATRTERIFALLETLSAEQKSDAPSLEYLRDMSNDEVKKELGRFKGLGPKTISCVMLFGMARDEFPVDTHVLRIAKLQRWVGSGATRESAYDALNVAVPDALKMDLHCLLVKHGKVCHRCAANNKPQFPPADGVPLVCPLAVSKVVGGVKKEVVSLMVKVEKEGDGKRAKASGKVKKEEQ